MLTKNFKSKTQITKFECERGNILMYFKFCGCSALNSNAPHRLIDLNGPITSEWHY